MQQREQPVDMSGLSMRGIRKSFGGVEVLHGVDFDLAPGEVHALLGENGAGKSTLVKILAGIYQADAGRMLLHGQELIVRDAASAEAAGIAIIHQELSYVPRLTVAENILLGRLPHAWPGIVRWGAVFAEAQQALRDFGSHIDARSRVSEIPLGQRQIVEIVRAVHGRARIIVMDEPTASLTESEVKQLFSVIAALKARGVSIVYISHHLDEIFQIADRATVLRDGYRVVTRAVAGSTHGDLVQVMVGRNVADLYQRSEWTTSTDTLLEVSHLTVPGQVQDVSFSVKRGEVLGLYGLIGAGQDVIARVLFGLLQPASGTITLEGRRQHFESPAKAIAAGVGFVPSDRKIEGLVLPMSVKQNLTLPLLDMVSRSGILAGVREALTAQEIVQAVGVRAAGLNQQVMYLSGGNQQKVVLGRWLARNVKVLVLNEPTRGVDVGAKAEIYAAIRKLTATGAGILLISSDLPEMQSITDRVAVIVRGQLVATLDSRQSTEHDILHYATTRGGTGYDA